MGRIYRPIQVTHGNNREVVIAIVDTGADETIISEKLAKKLNAKLYGTFVARCASKTEVRGKYVKVTLKEIWSNKKSRMAVGVSDIPFDTDDIDEEGIDVVLGVDFIQKTEFKIEM